MNLSAENLRVSRAGPGLSMTVTAKDCASGGVFQMEVGRTDGTATVFTHTLASGGGNLRHQLRQRRLGQAGGPRQPAGRDADR